MFAVVRTGGKQYRVAPGDKKEQKKAAPKAEAAPKAAADKSAAARAKETVDTTAAEHEASAIVGTPTENPAPNNEDAAGAEKPAAKKPAASKAKAETGSTKNAAPAKSAAKKSPKAK